MTKFQLHKIEYLYFNIIFFNSLFSINKTKTEIKFSIMKIESYYEKRKKNLGKVKYENHPPKSLGKLLLYTGNFEKFFKTLTLYKS